MTIRIETDDLTRPQVLALLEEHLRNMYAITPAEHVFALDAGKLRAPGVVFWTAWQEQRLLGCAALQQLAPTHALYRSFGFRECGPFGAYVDNGFSVFMSLPLDGGTEEGPP